MDSEILDPTPDDAGEEAKQPRRRCLNCHAKLAKKGTFCPRCAQRDNAGKVSLKELFIRFWVNFAHLDSKFTKMVWQLLLPARVTIEYFKGRQKRYPNPVQFFIVAMFFLFVATKIPGYGPTRHKNVVEMTRDEAKNQNNINIKPDGLYDLIKQQVTLRDLQLLYDSLPAQLRTPLTRQAVDTLILHAMDSTLELGLLDFTDSTGKDKQPQRGILDSVPINLINQSVRIATHDLVYLEPNQVAEKYHVDDWLHHVLLVQGLKSIKNPTGLMNNYLASMTWTLLAIIVFLSTVLALLYFRQRRYFVEHFVFLLHLYGGFILAATLGILIFKLTGWNWIWALLVLWAGIHNYKAMRKFYGQGRLKTLVKWGIFGMMHLLGFVLFFTLGLLVVLLLF